MKLTDDNAGGAREEAKFLNEFSLVPGGNAALKSYLDEHYETLVKEYEDKTLRDRPATQGLNALVESVLPDDAKENLRNVLINRSDRVVLIHNLPEKPGLEHVRTLGNNDFHRSYSFFIGNAIYANFGVTHSIATLLKRKNHIDEMPKAPFNRNHRDSLGEFIIFSSPYNGEQAITQMIQMRRAIEEIPKEQRERIMMSVHEYGHEKPTVMSLEDVWQRLHDQQLNKADRYSDNGLILQVDLLQGPKDGMGIPQSMPPQNQAFLDALARHTKPIELQPGTLAVLCQDGVFHAAAHGKLEAIFAINEQSPIPFHSRILIHNAGKSNAIQGI